MVRYPIKVLRYNIDQQKIRGDWRWTVSHRRRRSWRRLNHECLPTANPAGCPALHAVELVKWERIPLPVALNIGQERIVFVDRNVRVGYPAALEGKLRIQSSNCTLYLLASQSFAATRLQLQDTENGELILLDVSASKVSTSGSQCALSAKRRNA